jgi:hypothetical protein
MYAHVNKLIKKFKKKRKQRTTNAGQDGEREPSYTVGGNIN